MRLSERIAIIAFHEQFGFAVIHAAQFTASTKCGQERSMVSSDSLWLAWCLARGVLRTLISFRRIFSRLYSCYALESRSTLRLEWVVLH